MADEEGTQSTLQGSPDAGTPGAAVGQDRLADDNPDDSVAVLALLGLGLTLEGSRFVMRGVGLSQPTGERAQGGDRSHSDAEVMRHTLIGLVAESRARALERRAAARQLRRDFLHRLSRAARPLTTWLPVEVALTGADMLADYGQRRIKGAIERLELQGRSEEERAHLLAQRAVVEWIDEALTYFTHNPEVRALVTQQGEELATNALDDLRNHSESVDMWLAQATRKVLKRSNRGHTSAGVETASSPRIATSGSGD